LGSLHEAGYEVGFIMCDLTSLKGIAYGADDLFYGASSIKAPYFMSVVRQYPEALEDFKAEMQETLLTSSDYTYKQVLEAYGAEPMRTFCEKSGARASIAESLPWASYSARDLALMWGHAYALSKTDTTLDVLCSWCQSPTVSTIHSSLGSTYITRSKAGYINAEGDLDETINHGRPTFEVSDDGGIVYAGDKPYVVAIMSNVPDNHDILNDLTLSIDAAHSEM